jgi:sulfoxide reductase catalytic subunit YedY
MLIKRPDDIKPSEITPEPIYQDRRRILKGASQAALGLAAGAAFPGLFLPRGVEAAAKLEVERNTRFDTDEALTDVEDITRYNNFYEFGTAKTDPAKYAHSLQPHPWTVRVEGEVEKPADYHVEDLIKSQILEERIYRLRCVEAWSMVIPWVGIPLATLIKRFKPTAKAKYVEFVTLYDPSQMPGQRRQVLDWPYVEGLRMDEAMHPLTLLAVGLYGKELPNQNGAPIRLVVPWKYGFKSSKSIVTIRFTETMPQTSWNLAGPREYGFYANVNPEVDHPRWSQAKERRIGDFFKRKTLMFNGYAEQVAHLYAGMDLRKFY